MLNIGRNNRILIVDDSTAIHDDFRKVLAGPSNDDDAELDWIKAELLGEEVEERVDTSFEIDSAFQGQEGLAMVERSIREGRPYSMAFVDIRMPPGWDGVKTVGHLWQADPNLEVVICSAYSDYDWDQVAETLGRSDRLLVLKKPFDSVEVTQLAHALTRKWALQRATQVRADELELRVMERTRELEEANRRLAKEAEEREHMEAELRLAQKLEAVGQLAAGIAHEINTPIQYVNDSIHFLRTAFEDAEVLRTKYREGCLRLATLGGHEEFLEEVEEAEDDADLEYLVEHVPKAFERTMDGLGRVTRIVKAMKEFAHDDRGEKTSVDLNHALETTLEVAKNEYKYVARVETELGMLPPVMCLAGEVNQVFLNLIVNAGHAIGDVVGDTGAQGTIRIRSEARDGNAVITIEDTGGGIPETIRERVFDPFFTTKAVGRGTGQGLALARKVVVDKHGGSLTFTSEIGKGTQFVVCLPFEAKDPPQLGVAS